MKCKELFEKIDELNEKYLDVLEDVCNIESPTNFKKGVDEVGAYFINMAKQYGWKIEVLPQEISGDAICITLNPDADNAPVSISGHIDTVHPVGLFGEVPTRRDEKNVYGPGVMDCKGGVVAGFMAMEALEKYGFKSRPVHMIIQSDEENSSVTSNKQTIKFMCDKAKGSVAFLNLEGQSGDTVVIQRKGIIRYHFTVHGKVLHSARCADAANAIAEAAYKIIELEKMKDNDGLTCNCGVIQGGTVANTVAEECSFYADIRFQTPQELEWVKQKVNEVANNSTVAGCTCDLKEVSYRPCMPMSDRNVSLLETINDIYKQNNLPVLTGRSCLSGSDAAYITECGIPCVDNVGVEGGEIHSVREYIKLDALKDAAKRIASVIYCI